MKNLKKIKNKKGFTLIEMVIVITIIGILSSIAVTKYSTVQENAKKNADYATAANLATAAMISISDGHDSESDISPTGLLGHKYIQYIPKSKSVKNSGFTITAEGDSVTVKIGNETFYPRTNGVSEQNTTE